MSKPETGGAKSLEEILASIRKSLADEGAPDRPTEPKLASVKPTEPEHRPSPGINGASDGTGLLSGKLAGALSRSVANGTSLDDDVDALLAPQPAKPAASEPAASPKPSDADADAKDPLWFLGRKSVAVESKTNGAQPLAPRAPAGESKPAAAEPEVKLSRPEVLRASLPPLFGADAGSAQPVRAPGDAVKLGEFGGLAAKTTVPPAETAKSEPEVAFSPFASEKLESSPFSSPMKEEAEPTLGRGDASAQLSASELPTRPAFLDVEPEAAAVSKVVKQPELEPERAGVPTPGALERTIAELLEPVIRHWLDDNLPRMVEKVVREEVARAIAAERGARQG
jgi:cell pole-organizing protein PopZ